MNLAPRGTEADFGKENADTFRNVQRFDIRGNMNRKSVGWTQVYLRNQNGKLSKMISI